MKLPIPSLEITKANFIKHALAYPSFDKNLIDEFFDHSALKLQKLLQDYDLNMYSSYLERNWTKSYLRTRDPLSIASNFCFKLPKQYDLNDFIHTFARLIRAYDNDQLEFKNLRGRKLYKRQFEILRGGCRIPKSICDEFVLSFKNTNYISILHNNNLYRADILDDLSGIKMEFKATKNEISFAHLGFCDGEKAAKLYERYDYYNAFFNLIENSRFNISIINKNFDNLDQEQHYMLYHAPIYHYKSLNFIYNENTKNIYINVEHSFLDGSTIAYILEWIYHNLKSPTRFIKPIFIEQYYDDAYIQAIKTSLDNYTNLSRNGAFFCRLEGKKSLGFSKDFILQAAIVYACKNTYKRYVSQYEAVDVREYDYGRTECVRAVSVELQKALESFNREDFLLANEEHKNRIKSCKKAQGIDRHLFGLKIMNTCLNDTIANKFFHSSMYEDVCKTIISTSSLGKNAYVDIFYFHPVHRDGFGISYACVDDEYHFSCTYFDEDKFLSFKKFVCEFFTKF